MTRKAFLCAGAFFASFLLLAPACEDSPTDPGRRDSVPLGAWGGEEVSLMVNESGGEFERFCANGKIEQTLLLDASGRFDALGSYVQNRGGPSAIRRPVRYTGSVEGMTMTLTLTLPDTNERIGPFQLQFRRITQVPPCPLV